MLFFLGLFIWSMVVGVACLPGLMLAEPYWERGQRIRAGFMFLLGVALAVLCAQLMGYELRPGVVHLPPLPNTDI